MEIGDERVAGLGIVSGCSWKIERPSGDEELV
jgi:hypothetical protein